MALGVTSDVVCARTGEALVVTDESEATDGIAVPAGVTEEADPVWGRTVVGFEAACEGLLDETPELSVCVTKGPGVVFFGVGNRIGVTATTSAVSNSAIESLLSIYGTGSKPPGRKG